jgi:hypothetical protein
VKLLWNVLIAQWFWLTWSIYKYSVCNSVFKIDDCTWYMWLYQWFVWHVAWYSTIAVKLARNTELLITFANSIRHHLDIMHYFWYLLRCYEYEQWTVDTWFMVRDSAISAVHSALAFLSSIFFTLTAHNILLYIDIALQLFVLCTLTWARNIKWQRYYKTERLIFICWLIMYSFEMLIPCTVILESKSNYVDTYESALFMDNLPLIVRLCTTDLHYAELTQ